MFLNKAGIFTHNDALQVILPVSMLGQCVGCHGFVPDQGWWFL